MFSGDLPGDTPVFGSVAGLFDHQRNLIPLRHVKICGTLRDIIAEVSLEHLYHNPSDSPIEATFCFPIEADATVTQFEAFIDEKKIIGIVKEKQQALDDYDDAIASGKGAYLLQQRSNLPDVFQASIGNLPPKKEVKLKTTYVTLLKTKKNFAELTIPMSISPKYSPQSTSNQGDFVITPTAFQFDLEIDFSMASEVVSVESPSHQIQKRFEKKEGKVVFGCKQPLAKDFILQIELSKPHEPRIIMEHNVKENTVAGALILFPHVEETLDASPVEVVFAVDRSGSMTSGMSRVKEVLELLVHSLPAGSRFNIFSFGSSFSQLFKESQPYHEDALNSAKNLIKSMRADMGGTEILPVLKAIFECPTLENYPRQVILLTDGDVSNVDEIVQLVQKQRGMSRVFSVGIGAAAGRSLVKGIAKAGRGEAEFISPTEDYRQKTLAQLTRALQPNLSNVALSWQFKDPLVSLQRQSPAVPPPLYHEDRFLIYTIWKVPENFDWHTTEAAVTAAGPSGPVEYKLDRKQIQYLNTGTSIHQIAAKSIIQDLENEGDQNKNECILWSTKYGVAGRHTAFICVEDRKDAIQSTMVFERKETPAISSQFTLTVKPAFRLTSTNFYPTSSESKKRKRIEEDISSLRKIARDQYLEKREKRIGLGFSEFGLACLNGGSWNSVDKLKNYHHRVTFTHCIRENHGDLKEEMHLQQVQQPATLVSLQKAEGYWELESGLSKMLGIDLAVLELTLQSHLAGKFEQELKRIWATILAMTSLEKSDPITNQLVLKKAKSWLEKTLTRMREDTAPINELMQKAKQLLATV